MNELCDLLKSWKCYTQILLIWASNAGKQHWCVTLDHRRAFSINFGQFNQQKYDPHCSSGATSFLPAGQTSLTTLTHALRKVSESSHRLKTSREFCPTLHQPSAPLLSCQPCLMWIKLPWWLSFIDVFSLNTCPLNMQRPEQIQWKIKWLEQCRQRRNTRWQCVYSTQTWPQRLTH